MRPLIDLAQTRRGKLEDAEAQDSRMHGGDWNRVNGEMPEAETQPVSHGESKQTSGSLFLAFSLRVQ